MSDMRPVGALINLDGVDREFLFTLNVIDEIETEYDCTVAEALRMLVDAKTQIKTMRFFVKTLINDEVDRKKSKDPDCSLSKVTEQEAGWLVGASNANAVLTAIFRAYGISVPDADEDADPNGTSRPQSA